MTAVSNPARGRQEDGYPKRSRHSEPTALLTSLKRGKQKREKRNERGFSYRVRR